LHCGSSRYDVIHCVNEERREISKYTEGLRKERKRGEERRREKIIPL
jgi:hypothetical protein